MKAVVLGGGGFIGSNLVVGLAAHGHDVWSADIDLPTWRFTALADRCRAIGVAPTGYKRDLTNLDEVRKAIAGADWVFHLAADMGGVGYFHSNADLGASLRNGLITNNVLSSLHGQRLFYAASACAYPIEKQGQRLTEDMVGVGTPDALYGAEKLHGLRLCSKVADARVGIFDTIYGPLQEHEGRRMKFPAAVMTKALAARQTGQLELWGDGTQRRTYLYVDDAVDRIIQVMSADTYQGPVNIAATGLVSCMEVARMALDIVGADAEITTNPAEPSGVMSRECDTTKYDTLYGQPDETSLRDGLTKFAEWLEPTTTTRTPPHRAVMPPPRAR